MLVIQLASSTLDLLLNVLLLAKQLFSLLHELTHLPFELNLLCGKPRCVIVHPVKQLHQLFTLGLLKLLAFYVLLAQLYKFLPSLMLFVALLADLRV